MSQFNQFLNIIEIFFDLIDTIDVGESDTAINEKLLSSLQQIKNVIVRYCQQQSKEDKSNADMWILRSLQSERLLTACIQNLKSTPLAHPCESIEPDSQTDSAVYVRPTFHSIIEQANQTEETLLAYKYLFNQCRPACISQELYKKLKDSPQKLEKLAALGLIPDEKLD